ncbi:MAG: FMN-binding protein [Clostridiales bacterium]|nr:FMN-binding protein [Clostridiales bacterium]
MKKYLLLIPVLIIAFMFFLISNDDTIVFETVDYKLLKDGTYKGEYSTLLVHTIVEVSIKEYTIEDIQLIKHDCGKGQPAEKIIESMIENNTHHVDVVSGATMSSNVIMKAVETALIHSVEGR